MKERISMIIQLKNTKVLRVLAILTLYFLCSQNASAQLTGSIRKNFMGNFEKNCYDTQRAASVNQKASNDTLRKYCSCMATTVADTLSNTYVDEMERGNIPASSVTPVMQNAANYCTKKLNPSQFR